MKHHRTDLFSCYQLYPSYFRTIIAQKKLIPPHQFRSRNRHSTIDHIHQITDTMKKLQSTENFFSHIYRCSKRISWEKCCTDNVLTDLIVIFLTFLIYLQAAKLNYIE